MRSTADRAGSCRTRSASPARVEPLNLMWLEDMITGDYVPYVNADVYREVTPATTHADPHRRADLSAPELQGADRAPRGRHRRARSVRCRRPRRAQVDRRIRRPPRHADGAARHRQRPPRPRRAGPGLGDAAAQLHRLRVPRSAIPRWWYDIVDGLPDPIVRNGMIDVWDRPGMGVDIIPEKARALPLGGGRRLLRLSRAVVRRRTPERRPAPFCPRRRCSEAKLGGVPTLKLVRR